MSGRSRVPKNTIERYMTHYNCSYAEAKMRADRGDPLPEFGTGRATTKVLTSSNVSTISTVLGILGGILGSVSLLIRIFEKEET